MPHDDLLVWLRAGSPILRGVEPHPTLVINSSAVPGLAELSGLAYGGSLAGVDHEWRAVQDSGRRLVTLSLGLASDRVAHAPLHIRRRNLTTLRCEA